MTKFWWIVYILLQTQHIIIHLSQTSVNYNKHAYLKIDNAGRGNTQSWYWDCALWNYATHLYSHLSEIMSNIIWQGNYATRQYEKTIWHKERIVLAIVGVYRLFCLWCDLVSDLVLYPLCHDQVYKDTNCYLIKPVHSRHNFRCWARLQDYGSILKQSCASVCAYCEKADKGCWWLIFIHLTD